jgi:uncharacterized protein YbaA (DUF1428 family)
MPYVDGYVLPVPKKHLPAYRRMALKAGKIWREHGALGTGNAPATIWT